MRSRTGSRRDTLPWYAFIDDYGAKGDGMGRVTTSDGAPSSEEAQRAAAIVAALGKNAGSEDVFAAFEELDALPPDVVRSVLTPWTGPAPDPEQLDPATRKAHGFPPVPLEVHTIRIVKPSRVDELGRVAQEQVRVAGMTWDGLDLHATARLATDGSESSFAGALEHRVVSDEDGKPLFDVLRYASDSGTIFRAGTSDVVGAIAYGTVELKDRRARVALQASLATTEAEVVTPKSKPEPEVVAAPKPAPVAAKPAPVAAAKVAAAKVAAAKVAAAPDEEEEAPISSEAPTKRVLATELAAKNKVAAKTKAAPAKAKAKAKKTAAAATKKTASAPKKTAAAAKAAAAAKKTVAAPKKVAAKKTTAPAAKKKAASAAKAPAKKAATKPAKKTTAKKTTAKKTTAKKTTAKKTTAKKTTAKKTAAKKTAPAKKAPAKK